MLPSIFIGSGHAHALLMSHAHLMLLSVNHSNAQEACAHALRIAPCWLESAYNLQEPLHASSYEF